MGIEGTVFLITGGANGIGKEIARRMLSKGAKFVALLDFDESSGVKTQDEFNSTYGTEKTKFIHCDVSNEQQLSESFKTAFEVHGRLDVVINNAGVAKEKENTIPINLIGVIKGSYLAKKYLSKRNGGNGGVLINVASVAGIFPSQLPLYAASKYGVVGFTLSLPLSDLAFSLEDIRVSTVCPFFVDTQVGDDVIDNMPDHAKTRVNKELLNFVPISLVVDAYQMIVEDETTHNKLVRITPAKGIDFHPLKSPSEIAEEFGYLKVI